MRKSVGNRKIIMSDLQVTHQSLSRPTDIKAGENAGGRKIGLERVKDLHKPCWYNILKRGENGRT
jgi:inosine-uridine nucleoside N-ribohydrolase